RGGLTGASQSRHDGRGRFTGHNGLLFCGEQKRLAMVGWKSVRALHRLKIKKLYKCTVSVGLTLQAYCIAAVWLCVCLGQGDFDSQHSGGLRQGCPRSHRLSAAMATAAY
ncbi:MAG: hypothetical protein ACRESP_22205, partial [Pseudomonas sp.]